MTDSRSAAELDAELEGLLDRLERAGQARRNDPMSREVERAYLSLLEQVRPLERAIALARGEEAAVPIAWEVPWDTGAPMPHVLASAVRTCLIYLTRGPSPEEAGWPFPVGIDPHSPEPHLVALVEFS